jgi:dienelactone hydrolase
MSKKIEIRLNSESVLADCAYNIIVDNLDPHKIYEIKQELKNYYCINVPTNLGTNNIWESKISVQADESGRISLKDSCAIDGSYKGIAQMGLFYNSQPKNTKKIKLPQNLKSIAKNDKFQIVISIVEHGKVIAANSFLRYYQLPTIASKDIDLGEACGRVFFEKRQSQKPAIIVVSGSDGRIEKAQNIAQLFASHGFVALAVGYFGLTGLSRNLEKIPIEIIERSASYLALLPQVDEKRIGLYGRSKGAELALTAATYFQNIKCVVANSPSNIVLEGMCGWKPSHSSSWTYQGKELPFKKFHIVQYLLTKIAKRPPSNNPKNAEIRIEKYNGALLCLGAQEDEIWDSAGSIEKISARIKLRKQSDKTFTAKIYKNCGHMLTVANQPNIRYKKHYAWEGSLQDSIDSWEQTINFFQQNL